MNSKITKEFSSSEYGDFVTYYYDVTKEAKSVFGDIIKSAKRTILTVQDVTPEIEEEVESEARFFENGENHWDNISEFESIYFEFTNGKKVCFSNSQIETAIYNKIEE